MNGEEFFFAEFSGDDFNNGTLRNNTILLSDKNYIVFINTAATNRAETKEVLRECCNFPDSDICVMGKGINYGELSFEDILFSFDMDVYAIAIKRDVFAVSGPFNEKLPGNIDYEFLLRSVKEKRIFGITCAAECESVCSAQSLAYIVREHMLSVNEGLLENYLNAVLEYAGRINVKADFDLWLKKFMNDSSVYEAFARNTAPYFVISGDDTCYGVLRHFAGKLADSLADIGQAVITTDGRYGRYTGLESIEGKLLKGIIGFQAPVLENKYFRSMKAIKFQFWFDNPAFFSDMFSDLDDRYYILCQDAFYAEYIRTYYGAVNACQFPPAGTDAGYKNAGVTKKYDIAFVGTYNEPDMSVINDDIKMRFFEYMISHPDRTFEQGVVELFGECNVRMTCFYLSEVCRTVINYYRKLTMETILKSGLRVDVFGDSWKKYSGMAADNLIIHKELSPEEALFTYAGAKIGLNIMTWHKAGMTERIADIMLSGAVCVSDETVYLKENFKDNEGIVLFNLSRLGELPDKLKKILSDDALRKSISDKAYDVDKEAYMEDKGM